MQKKFLKSKTFFGFVSCVESQLNKTQPWRSYLEKEIKVDLPSFYNLFLVEQNAKTICVENMERTEIQKGKNHNYPVIKTKLLV